MGTVQEADGLAHARPRAGGGVLLVSHGYENIYERGFCNGLTDAGMPFTLISSDQTDYAGLRAGTRTLNLRGSQLSARARWRKAGNLLRYHLRLMAHVAKTRPRVLHVIGLIAPAWWCGLLQAAWFRLFCGRYLLTVHDTEPHDRGTPWNRRLYAWSFRVADGLVVHTQKVRDELIHGHGIAAHRIVVMQHGLEPFVSAPPALPPASQPSAALRLLFFGKVMRYKGIDLLLDAIADLPFPVTLTIAGVSHDAELVGELRAHIARHPHSTSIHWDNAYVPEAAIPGLFLDADALVLPYRRIDQSGVLFQALRFGLPIVASRVGAFADYVSDDIGEICEPHSAATLRDALLRLMARRAALDREQVRAAGSRFEWQRTVIALQGVYANGSDPAGVVV